MLNSSRPAFSGLTHARTGAFVVSAIITTAFLAATPASALVIHPEWDSSVTSNVHAAAIEADFNAVASVFDSEFANPVTVNVGVGWGEIGGSAMGSGALGESEDAGVAYNYAQLSSDLRTFSARNPLDTVLAQAVTHLPSSAPSGPSTYLVPTAEAKALGLVSGTGTAKDGSVGFSSTFAFDFNPADGITAGQYDLESTMAHELSEVLGRVSGLESPTPTFRTAMDLYRYAAPGQLGFSYSSPAYFSVNGGVTRLGDFNGSGGGDRGDWLPSTTGLTDLQSAAGSPGKAYGLSVADIAVLDAIGWGGSNPGDTRLATPTLIAHSFSDAAVPEPAAWILLIGGLGLAGAGLRRRQAIARLGAQAI